MTLISTRILLGAAGAAGGSSHWLLDAGTNSNDFPRSLTLDSSGNIYIVGYCFIGSAYDFLIAKYDNDATFQWARTLGDGSSKYDQGFDIALDSSNNVYVAGFKEGSNDNYDFILAKYNSSGTIQWQRSLASSVRDLAYGVAVDSSGNAYITGYTKFSNSDLVIAKYNTSGTIQWQRTLSGSGNDRGYDVAVDSSGNAYVLGITNSEGAGNQDILLVKYNTSGAIQWQRTLGGSALDSSIKLALDSSGNPHICGHTETVVSGNGQYDFITAKYNTSGTLQWQRKLGTSTNTEQASSLRVDSSGNVYIIGRIPSGSGGAGGEDAFFAKYNSSGTIQWQRSWGGTGTEVGYDIDVDNSGNIYVLAYTRFTVTGLGGYDIQLLKLPDDGSLTGTYGSYTYGSTSLTDAAASLTSSTSTLTDAASSLTSATSSLTDASLTLTSSVTTL